VPAKDDSFAAFDPLLAEADVSSSPWTGPNGRYEPHLPLLKAMLAIPISQGEAAKSQGGRTIKALDAWIAHELRRAGFAPHEVWPRTRQPRVLPASLSDLEEQLETLAAALTAHETEIGRSLRPVLLRRAIRALRESLPRGGAAHILGRFYAKQVDVVISSWQHGPELLVSTKSQFSSYNKNRNNRYEETIGEATNLRDRHPMAAMAYAFLVRSNIYEERGAFALLRDLLVRLRKPDGPYAATMLL